LVVKPSTESLAAALSPETPSNPGAVSGKPAGEGRSKPARFGRDMAAVVVVVLVMATAFWLRKDILLHDHSNAPVASKVPAQSAPASEQHTPPAGALLPPASKQAAGTQPGVKQPSTRLTAGMLWNKTFLYRRVSAPDAPASYPTENIATLTLRKDGTIAGSISLNESFWLIDSDGHLVFKHRDGRLSTIFTLAEQRGGKSFFSGTFLFLKGIQHFLDER